MENIEIMEEVIGKLQNASEAVDNAVETVEDKVKDEATEEVTVTTEEVGEAAEKTPEEVAEKKPEEVVEKVAEKIVDKVEESKDEVTIILKEVASLKNMVKDAIKKINENDTKIKEVRGEIAELFFDGTVPKTDKNEIDLTNLF